MTDPSLPKKRYVPTAQGTLQGVRVLDLSRLVAGNTLTQVLGDFGAEVIKVEPPAGDTLRAWQTNGVQTNWKLYARNKKSLCLELRKPEARELLLELVPVRRDLRRELPPGHAREDGARARRRCSSAIRSSSSCASPAGARTGPTAAVPASARWSRACRASRRSTASPTASRCCRRCTSPTPSPGSTARRAR